MNGHIRNIGSYSSLSYDPLFCDPTLYYSFRYNFDEEGCIASIRNNEPIQVNSQKPAEQPSQEHRLFLTRASEEISPPIENCGQTFSRFIPDLRETRHSSTLDLLRMRVVACNAFNSGDYEQSALVSKEICELTKNNSQDWQLLIEAAQKIDSLIVEVLRKQFSETFRNPQRNHPLAEAAQQGMKKLLVSGIPGESAPNDHHAVVLQQTQQMEPIPESWRPYIPRMSGERSVLMERLFYPMRKSIDEHYKQGHFFISASLSKKLCDLTVYERLDWHWLIMSVRHFNSLLAQHICRQMLLHFQQYPDLIYFANTQLAEMSAELRSEKN